MLHSEIFTTYREKKINHKIMFASKQIVFIFAPANREVQCFSRSIKNGEVAQLVRASDS